ncbi:hypothetical protein Ddc_14898 [Ditylenchus destructor]|nr:hypothetical protein Ddc_14898 [Ditylenchus destructor]
MFPRKKYSVFIPVAILLSLVVLIHAKGRTPRRGGGNTRPIPPERPDPKAPATGSRCPIKKCTKPVNCQNLATQGRLKCNKCNFRRRAKRVGEQTGPGNCGPSRGGNNVQPGGNGGDQPNVNDPAWWAQNWENWAPDGFEPYNEVNDRNNPRSIWYRGARGSAVLKACLKGYCINDPQCRHMARDRGMPDRACGTCHMKKGGYGTCAHGVASDRGFKYDGKFADPHQYGPNDENMRKCPSMYCRTDDQCDIAARKLKIQGDKGCGKCWWPISPRCGQEPAKENLWKANSMALQLWEAPQIKLLVTKKCDFKSRCTDTKDCELRAVTAGLGPVDCGLCHPHTKRCMLSPTYRVKVYERNPALQPDSPQAGGSGLQPQPQPGPSGLQPQPQAGPSGLNLGKRRHQEADMQPLETPDSVLENIWQSIAETIREEEGPLNEQDELTEMIKEESHKRTIRCGQVRNCQRSPGDEACDEFAKNVIGYRFSRHACGFCDRADGRCKWTHGGSHHSDEGAGTSWQSYNFLQPLYGPHPMNPYQPDGRTYRDAHPEWNPNQQAWSVAVRGGAFQPDKSLRPRSRPINMAKCNTIWCNGDHNKCINGAENFGLQKGQCGRWCSPTTNRCERAIGSPVH